MTNVWAAVEVEVTDRVRVALQKQVQARLLVVSNQLDTRVSAQVEGSVEAIRRMRTT